MKNLGILLPLTSAIFGYCLLILNPVLAQTNPTAILTSETQTNTKLRLNNQEIFGYDSITSLPDEQIEVSKLLSPSQRDLKRDFTLSQSQHPWEEETDEVIDVEQLRDVSPGDWAYEALRNLVDKYRCITASPPGTFDGNRAMNRYEFADTLNNCLQKFQRGIYSLSNKFATQEELAVMQRLQAEFATELKAVSSRIDNLEEKVSFLKAHQFSTTTVLRGSVNFNLIGAFGNKKAVSRGENPREQIDDNLTLSSRASLNLDTSFRGKDLLRTNVFFGNGNSFGSSVTGTNMTQLVGTSNTDGNLKLGSLFYQFPIGKQGTIAIAPAADFPTRIFPALNPVNSISNFGGESPIYSFAFGGGAVAYYNFTDKIAGGVSYLTTSASNPLEGLFGGQYTLLSQVTYTPSDKLGVAFTYGRYYASEPGSSIDVTGGKGSSFAQFPFGSSTPTSSNAYGLQFTYKLNKLFTLGGWVSYFNAHAEASPVVSGVNGSKGSNADIWSWALTGVLADLGKLGSQLNLVFGMPPKVTNNDIAARADRDTSLHFEISYRYPLTDRIFITPGFVLITNPEHNAANDTVWVGLMRTSFTF
ncbi:iron uptake porin [Aetokthonos hydrillicola Thurmond2011]|jgi:hypothetical protein|uniref:Iron uptake porin n=1 Tax=Aetokthonos hydrillicola Thurmond2011 TaxID=2712845 RepID=A0AAP5M7D1_9CYAN|nr:iron uptake porin [Aetokthonos hydrillicola]MBO3458972.1 carbohydrate porin [Aetokthonos hydrillicola CCALA 1050]MBW4589080.1 iron uptake porin [Aetokthonos hydrillicola CCALA 1050]MDR9894965.1 iron uptake porin [Aetokthonos hydrillicola Thurmond2011]